MTTSGDNFEGQTQNARRLDPAFTPKRVAEKPSTVDELRELIALIALMRANGVQSLSTPDGYLIVLGPVPAPAKVKPVEPDEPRNEAEDEEAMLFAHLG